MRAGARKKGATNDVALMEQRLALLKQQMEEERLRRKERLSSTGGESFWQSGRRGAIRGAGVSDLVRSRARSGAVRAAAAPARTSPIGEFDRESPVSAASTEESVLDAGEGPSSLAHSRPVSRDTRASAPQRPPSPKLVAAMECQTDDLPQRAWGQATPRVRPQSARAPTDFEKIMKARQQQAA